MLGIVLVVISFIVIAMLWNEGMWSNAIALFNVFFAGVVSTNYFEPFAKWIEGTLPSFAYVADYLAFWVIFAFAFNVGRAVTDAISKHKVRFRKPVEHTGRILFAVLTAWMMVCIFCASLHLAPLAQSPLRGSFAKDPLAGCFFGLAPDRYWLAFMHSRSKGSMGSGSQFDPQGEFVLKYGTRRYNLQAYNKETDGKILVRKR